MALDPTQFRIIHHAKGGLKLPGLNIVFLEIGTNDLALEVALHKLAQELKRFATYLLRQPALKVVIISQVVFRKIGTSRTPDSFNSRVTQYDALMPPLTKDVPV